MKKLLLVCALLSAGSICAMDQESQKAELKDYDKIFDSFVMKALLSDVETFNPVASQKDGGFWGWMIVKKQKDSKNPVYKMVVEYLLTLDNKEFKNYMRVRDFWGWLATKEGDQEDDRIGGVHRVVKHQAWDGS